MYLTVKQWAKFSFENKLRISFYKHT